MLYRHLLWGWSGWERQALQYHDRWAGNETHWSIQESEDSLSESEDCGPSESARYYSQRVSVPGCWKLGCSSPSWLTLITSFGWHCWLKGVFFLLLKKTASRTTRLPRLFIMIRLSKVRRICCYKTIFSYISFTFCHGFAVVPCNSGRNLWMYICLFHHTNQVRFLMSFIWISI